MEELGRRSFGPVDVLVNAAGVPSAGVLGDEGYVESGTVRSRST